MYISFVPSPVLSHSGILQPSGGLYEKMADPVSVTQQLAFKEFEFIAVPVHGCQFGQLVKFRKSRNGYSQIGLEQVAVFTVVHRYKDPVQIHAEIVQHACLLSIRFIQLFQGVQAGDVYKRQGEQYAQENHQQGHSNDGRNAVSYTHLDVYKRQPEDRGNC